MCIIIWAIVFLDGEAADYSEREKITFCHGITVLKLYKNEVGGCLEESGRAITPYRHRKQWKFW